MREETNGQETGATGRIPIESIHEQVQRILSSRRFAGSERHCRLLRYLLEQTLEGRGDQLKEYVLGVEVFDRQSSFDPQTDPIVRSELSRLRAKLKDYYEGEGRDDSVIIDLPKRSYSLLFQLREAPVVEPPAKPARSWLAARRVALATSMISVLGLAGGGDVVRARARASLEQRLNGHLTSLVVLPFVNLNGGPESEYFCDGLTEEIINWLAEIEGLRVVSRTSTFQFKGSHEDLRTIAARLRVSLVLEGAVRRFGDRWRITTRLVDATDGYQLGSHVYDRGLHEVPDVQQEIARHVASTLRIPRVGGHGQMASERFTSSVEAYRYYLEGRYHANNGGELDLKKSIRCYERATAADPNYAPAHASLANAYISLALQYEVPPREMMQRAKQAAQTAVKTGRTFPDAHSALGSIFALYDWDWEAAGKEFNRALELDPSDSAIREAYAMRYLVPRGRLNSALFEMQLAQSLDPFSPGITLSLGKVHHFRRNPDQAIETFRRVLQLDSSFEAAPLALAKAYSQKSLLDQALNTLKPASAPVEDEARLAVLGHLYALSGHPDRAREALDQLREMTRQRYVSGYFFALIHLGLGEKAEALDYLERAAAERSPLIVYLKVNPIFDSLRSEPRFATLLKRSGLGG